MTIRAAIIGCGKRGANFGRACLSAGDVELVGFADPVNGRAAECAAEFNSKAAFTDTATMLAQVKPDFACLVTRPSVRLEPVRQCADAGVKAMLSEKPMAASWAEARALHAAAVESGMKLSFCHQRRCGPQYIQALGLLRSGAVGDIRHIIAHCDNMYDWGTHWFDMINYFNGEAEAEWVMAQVDRRNPKFVFDQPMDRCGVSVVKFTNDMVATVQTGAATGEDCGLRIIGDAGVLWVGDNARVELLNADGRRDASPGEDAPRGVPNGVHHVIHSYRDGKTSLLDSANALRATQLIFATYHSAMIGDKVALPLDESVDLSLTDVFESQQPA